MITIINVELRLKTLFVWFRFALVSFGFFSQWFRLVSFRNGFVWFRFAKYSKPICNGFLFRKRKEMFVVFEVMKFMKSFFFLRPKVS